MDGEGRRGGCSELLSALCRTLAISFVVIIAAVFASMVFFGLFIHDGCPSQRSNCASNLKQIGAALKMYLVDWSNTYPTNRPRVANGSIGAISSYVKLTPAGVLDTKGRQKRFRHGLNWIEALYDYVEPPAYDSFGAWECRSAKIACYPDNSRTAYATYALNRNLVERPETCVREADRTLLVREIDRHVNAELRPTNYSCGQPGVPPDSPFLTDSDSRIGRTDGELHALGSQILFADSHVELVAAQYLPEQQDIAPAKFWDAGKRQWRVTVHQTYGTHEIAITP